MIQHLRPLAIAANVLQTTHCRLDQVLIVLGALHYEYSLLVDQESVLVKEALLSSISRRWEKADQPIYIAAVILNPLIKTQIFANIQQVTFNGIYNIFAKLWTRFSSRPPPPDLLVDLKDYLSNKGIFNEFQSLTQAAQLQASFQVSSFSMLYYLANLYLIGQ